MQIAFLLFLALFGTIFGSFASVLIYRFHSQEGGIMTGRSHCKDCKNTLGFFDLFPIFSYLFQGGKCRYCQKGISILYPILEITMGFAFFLVGLYLVNFQEILLGNIQEILRLLFFLYIVFTIVVFSVYDIKFTEIPIELLGPAILMLLILLIGSLFSLNLVQFFSFFKTFENITLTKPIFNGLVGALFIYTFFYIQIFFPGMYYAIEKKKYKIILTQAIEYFTIPFYIITSVFFNFNKEDSLEETDEEEQIYTGIGHGDLWIGVFMGLVGGFKIAVLGLAIGYLIGAIVGIYILAVKKERNTYIAFGPFLGIGLLMSLMFYDKIINLFFAYYV